MIVVAVIGVLAAIALPSFDLMSCRAEQTEAKGHGSLIIKLADLYAEDVAEVVGPVFSAPCDGPFPENTISFGVTGPRRYRYDLMSVGEPTRFQLIITGCRGRVDGDFWYADGLTPLENLGNACKAL